MDGRWYPSNERTVYESEWLTVNVCDVELPDRTTIEHHIVQGKTADSANVVLQDEEGAVLLLWRHRFITDSWGWELPAGMVEAGERPIDGARRELLEETGWEAGELRPWLRWFPMPGLMPAQFHTFRGTSPRWTGAGSDPNEVADLAWVAPAAIATMIDKGEISDGFTLPPLLHLLREPGGAGAAPASALPGDR